MCASHRGIHQNTNAKSEGSDNFIVHGLIPEELRISIVDIDVTLQYTLFRGKDKDGRA